MSRFRTVAVGVTGWIYLRQFGLTVRWQRGDEIAYVFTGKQFENYPDSPIGTSSVGAIAVASRGWTDLNEIKIVGEKWAKANYRSLRNHGDRA